MNIKSPKKLIEVALPLDDINAAAAREKSIRHGHPSTLHLWWARRPLAAARAVLFAQLVNDPGYQRELGLGVNKKKAEIKHEKLFHIIRDLVKWENTNNEEVLNRARETGQIPIAPVDLAQSAICPGMAIFSKYKAVLNQDGSAMSVYDAQVPILGQTPRNRYLRRLPCI
ncbi:MAG: DUF1156 domain-containing protein [Sedimenticola sp.]